MESKDVKNRKDTEDAGSSGIAGTGDARAGPERYMASPRVVLPSFITEDHKIVEMPPDCSSPTELEPMRPHGEDCNARGSISPFRTPEPYRAATTGAFDDFVQVQGGIIDVDLKIAAMPPDNSSPEKRKPKRPNRKDRDPYGSISPFMMPELYGSATTGDVDAFAEAVADDAERLRIKEVTPRGDSVLHVAASFGHDRIVDFILQKCRDLVELKNRKGDLALHVAASSGHLNVVKSLVSFATNSACREGQNTLGATLLWEVNQQGNTALHVALENRQPETALFLVDADPRVSYCLNREWKSPFYMAIKSGYLEIVEKIITKDQGKSVERTNLKPEDSELLHASIIGRNKDVVDRICSIYPELIYSTDEEGRTPLSLAASMGFADEVCYILEKFTEGTYLRDQNGFFPIHSACTRGHIKIVDAFLKHYPDSAELRNKKGENILHVAAKNGRAKLVGWMLKSNKLDMLINEKDGKGFTPLHWATSNFHPKVVSTLTWDKRVKLEIMNNEGLTALDIAEKNIDSESPFRKRLTLTALKSANAPRSERGKRQREMVLVGEEWEKSSRKSPDLGRVNTLLLVASLVATVTYACGFTLPGGNNDSDPDPGMATLVRKLAFQFHF